MAELSAQGETPEVLFWVGCAGSFDDRARRIVKAFAHLLEKAGVCLAPKRAALATLPSVPAMSFFFRCRQ